LSSVRYSQSKISDEKVSTSTVRQTSYPQGNHRAHRYVRVELLPPIEFRLLEWKNGKLKPSRDRISGEILFLSQVGMILSTSHSIPEESFVILTLNLSKSAIQKRVLGKIRRVESSEEGGFLVGIKFASKDERKKLSLLRADRASISKGDRIKPPIVGNHHQLFEER
jgi:hypothetical protein